MGVKLRKKGGKWYVFVSYHGKRKAKCIGTSRQVAEEVRRKLEARLALGDLGFLAEESDITFKEYSDRWLREHSELDCKASTHRSYEQLLRLHVVPKFGRMKLTDISRDSVKGFLATLSRESREAGQETTLKYSRNTLRLIGCALRGVLSAAVEDGLIESNPASKIGRFVRTSKPAHQADAMTRWESESFLGAVRELFPDWYPFFLTALRAGLRRGELIALRWGDIQFGVTGDDPNRYILVQRNYVLDSFTTPKNKKSRRVDLSRQLRGVLLDLRDKRLLEAFTGGQTSISDDLVFPSQTGTPIKPDNIAVRYMLPALERAGLRRFRFHDLRHTFGSLLIQGGASLAYVKEQMGHSSIQVTVDTYGHLIPGADIKWIDRLDEKATPQQSATPVQPLAEELEQDVVQVVEGIWLPPRDSNPDMLIQSQPCVFLW